MEIDRPADGGQRRPDVRGDRRVVEADDRKILRAHRGRAAARHGARPPPFHRSLAKIAVGGGTRSSRRLPAATPDLERIASLGDQAARQLDARRRGAPPRSPGAARRRSGSRAGPRSGRCAGAPARSDRRPPRAPPRGRSTRPYDRDRRARPSPCGCSGQPSSSQSRASASFSRKRRHDHHAEQPLPLEEVCARPRACVGDVAVDRADDQSELGVVQRLENALLDVDAPSAHWDCRGSGRSGNCAGAPARAPADWGRSRAR